MIDFLYGPVAQTIWQRAAHIQLLICDVDGVFSDGRIYMGNNGEELKAFHTRDGYGIKCAMNAGIQVAIITGRQSKIVSRRMHTLGVSHLYQGVDDKLTAYTELRTQFDLTPEQIAYIGDDLIDWPVMEQVGLSICVQDGHPLLAQRADFCTSTRGGFGAVREVCDLLLAARNQLEAFQGRSI